MSTPIAATDLKDKLSRNKVCLIDVRRKSDYEKSPETIEGATWHDPEHVEEWGKTLPKDQELVVYCVKGGSVSQSVADSLQASHPGVRFLAGGILGWQDEQK
ncbi:MAG: rhodanese-like domain-containing protein [Desulfobulbaceae bacterium]